jgi:hypothetical protein
MQSLPIALIENLNVQSKELMVFVSTHACCSPLAKKTWKIPTFFLDGGFQQSELHEWPIAPRIVQFSEMRCSLCLPDACSLLAPNFYAPALVCFW